MATKQKIKIKDLRSQDISKISLLVDIANGDFFKDAKNVTLSEQISLIAQYLDLSFSEVSRWTFNSIKDTTEKIVNVLNSYEFREPRRKITSAGIEYRLITEPRKMTAGWWHHVESIKAHTSPEQFLGLAYIEKGLNYADVDENDNITNPTDVRGKEIAKQFTAADFIDLMGFFLSKFESVSLLTLIDKNHAAKMMIKKMTSPNSGHLKQ